MHIEENTRSFLGRRKMIPVENTEMQAGKKNERKCKYEGKLNYY